ncbi:hypothetical protein HG535_0F01210 [Zygotorulaspora mrakii]|uniref:Uncharacterized protein n=1 Tax=Zygotorulaspora mrakii TaxID=42260 RepID=A0A7H9B4T9_ZYGMR|nr:uncharacterized protein HG535_0F01210 [Zygotorulaspora mrakii]QLG73610.1 hypothetical protein HG535_0F01210 [Zygotorulaspora mrakii]
MSKIIDKSVFDYGGKTLVSLASDNKTLCVANKNGLSKVLQINKPEDEPEILEIAKNLTSIRCASDTTCLVTTLQGDAYRYDLEHPMDQLLVRSALPFRDCTILHGGRMAVFGGDDLEMSIVELDNEAFTKHVVKVDEQISQLSYSTQTNLLSVSFINGNVQFFSLSSTRPNKVQELKGYIPANSYNDAHTDRLLQKLNEIDEVTYPETPDDGEDHDVIKDAEFCDENRICTRPAWHPTGLQFGLPCEDSTVKIFSVKGYELIKTLVNSSFSKSHFIDLQFEPLHGNYVAAVDLQNRLTIWNWLTSEISFKKEFKQKITNFVWRPQPDSKTLDLIMGTWSGEIIIVHSAVESVKDVNSDYQSNVDGIKKTSLFVESDLEESDSDFATGRHQGPSDKHIENGEHVFDENRDQDGSKRIYHFDDEEDFIDDDDGAGYVTEKKHKNDRSTFDSKNYQGKFITPASHTYHYKPLSPGATPFGNSDRRYLTMNNVGYVSLVKNNLQNSITVSFFDIGRFKEYHFEDIFGYDVCSLNENGALFAQSRSGQVHYRSHTMLNSNWTKTIPIQQGEKITCVAATPKRIFLGTSFGYMRTFNQFGVPLSVEKMSPVVAISAQDYRVFAVHYSQYNGVSYSIFEQSSHLSKYYQKECSLPIALPQSIARGNSNIETDFTSFNPLGIKSLFFSTYGDPCIFASDNVLLVLSKWRHSAESKWLPLLDANMEVWRISGGNEKSQVHIWPLGLTYDTLNCILVKGKNMWPEFPLPLPSEMEVRIPIYVKSVILQEIKKKRDEALAGEAEAATNTGHERELTEVAVPSQMAAEEEFLRSKVLSSLLGDSLENDGELYGNENELLASLNGAYDKSLLRLFATACSDQNSDMALSLAQELKQDRALIAAAKISERAELPNLVKRVNDLREARFEQQMNYAQ